MKTIFSFALKLAPWLITGLALYIAFSGIDLKLAYHHLRSGDLLWLSLAIFLTFSSYLIRSWRWQFCFPRENISFLKSFKVLILGFFMNNVLPARTGELVRAHMGSKVTKETRTLVLATIASERIADGLMISVLFLILTATITLGTATYSLYWICALFFVAALVLLVVLGVKDKIFAFLRKLEQKYPLKPFIAYIFNRIEIFIEGLSPVLNESKLLKISSLSVAVWLCELAVYLAVLRAYQVEPTLGLAVIFLAAVNFSSLIPSAPGAIGVIEAVASGILVSQGIPKELALPMVIAQHLIQYLVVGIPGLIVMISWKIKPSEVR